MDERTTILELLQTSPDRWTALSLVGREWRHVARFTQAWERWVSAMRQTSGSVISLIAYQAATDAGLEPAEETVEPWRFWKRNPDKIRTQFRVGRETVTAVFAGPQWWSRTPGRPPQTNGGDPHFSHGLGPAEVLVDTRNLLSLLKIDEVSRTTFLSRPAYVATARPANQDEQLAAFGLHGLGNGADRYELIVDAEIGIVLRSKAEVGGKAFRILQVEECGIDEELPESLFSPDSLSGEAAPS